MQDYEDEHLSWRDPHAWRMKYDPEYRAIFEEEEKEENTKPATQPAAAPPGGLTRFEVRAEIAAHLEQMLEPLGLAIGKVIKEVVAEQMNQILQRLEALESHSEAVMDALDHSRERIEALDIKLTEQSKNARRGVQ